MEFLYSPNRLNVATSRAQGRAQILAAAELLERIDGTLRSTVVEPDWL